MEKTLFINACVRPQSRTRVLAQHVLDKIGGEIQEVDLTKENIKSLDLETLTEREKLSAGGDFSHELFKYAKQFAEADTIVLAAPYWDLAFPAIVKTYLEYITVSGITFYYTEEGFPKGLCRAKKFIYVMTAGGPTEGMNYGFDYVNALCRGFYGIEDVKCYQANMLDVIGADVDGIMAEAIKEIEDSDMA